ncbi:MAG: alpha-L-fucosidase, partial [Tannerella sp.]|nr:alpha-L-fucosidase [Tannerella sp.]
MRYEKDFSKYYFSRHDNNVGSNCASKDTNYAKLFPAKKVDADQWAKTAKEAGMGYILFLTKHHDDFCLWDTKTTERKVTNAPLGKDVLAELRKSCDKRSCRRERLTPVYEKKYYKTIFSMTVLRMGSSPNRMGSSPNRMGSSPSQMGSSPNQMGSS